MNDLEAGDMKTIRKQFGYAQQQVANVLGCSKSLVCMIESGRVKPSYQNLVTLEDLFGVSHRELFAAERPKIVG